MRLQEPYDRSRRRFGAVVILTALLTMMGSATSAQTILPGDIAPFTVEYTVGNDLITAGSAKLSLEQKADLWQYSLRTRPTGLFKLTGKGRILETSLFELAEIEDGLRLQPINYAYRQDDERSRQVDAMFDWDKQTVSWQRRGREGLLEFEQAILDRLSVTLAVMNSLRHGFDVMELPVFDNGEVKTMQFENLGEVTLDTPLGKTRTLRVRSRNASGGSRYTDTWFAPELDYLPVRIEQHKRKELIARLSLRKLQNRVTELEIETPELEEDGGDTSASADDSEKGSE